ncbi:MAG: hypothetical protein WC763_04685 [Candidatus Paceibacterota bacterium]|jgi:hypothetical protein
MESKETQGNTQEGAQGVPAVAGAKAPGAPYRGITVKEREALFAFYEKHNGNMMAMIRDKDCLFKGYNQIRYYASVFNFSERLVEIRRIRATEVMEKLKDGKIRALENAMRLLEPQHRFVFDKRGIQVFDLEGKPIIVETLPHYKEIQAAWEMIKTELGEPTSIHKNDLTTGGEKIQGNVIQFVDFNAPKGQ